ncbi:MAG TPA: hypothetical protein VMC80_00620 [Patescibacteria group bacterium]|nr:hypothetical protein [Patescibacteria group bacterium]
MKIHVKIKFKSDIDKIESFGNWRYLVNMKLAGDDPQALSFFTKMFSKFSGADPKHIRYLGKQGEEHIFEI